MDKKVISRLLLLSNSISIILNFSYIVFIFLCVRGSLYIAYTFVKNQNFQGISVNEFITSVFQTFLCLVILTSTLFVVTHYHYERYLDIPYLGMPCWQFCLNFYMDSLANGLSSCILGLVILPCILYWPKPFISYVLIYIIGKLANHAFSDYLLFKEIPINKEDKETR